MAEDQGGAAAVQDDEQAFVYPVKIEDVGPATKKVSVEIPAERIEAKLSEQFKELRRQATIPGFRVGHAPQKLIEKRFDKDARDQVRRALVSESYEQAIEKNALSVIGEPQFEDADKLELPADGPLTYSFQVEVQPEIHLPDLATMKVKKPRVQVEQADVDRAMHNLRAQQGTLVPVEDRGVQPEDYLTADVHLKHEDAVVEHQHDASLVARAGRLAGIQIDDLAQRLEGLKPGETRAIDLKAPETHRQEAIRGKDVRLEVALKSIKRLEPAEINAEFLAGLGMKDEPELREEMRQELIKRIEYDARLLMRRQVSEYLLANVNVDLPAKLSAQQAERIVSRRGVDLMMRGMDLAHVEANIEQLMSGAQEEAVRELKLFFILQHVAKDRQVEVDEGELNGQIALLAAHRGRRPEKLKQEMAKDGSLANLYVQLREQKAIDGLLAAATIEEVDLKEFQQQQSAPSQAAPVTGDR